MNRLLIAACAVFLIAAAPVLAPGTEADRAPGWLVKPDGDKIARFYPDRAMRNGVEGQATLTCIAGVDTRLRDCKVVSEDPPAYGFGAAALNLSVEMRMAPAIRQGLPTDSLVRVPLAFKMPDPDPLVRLEMPTRPMLFVLAAGFFLVAGLLLAGLVMANRAFGHGTRGDA